MMNSKKLARLPTRFINGVTKPGLYSDGGNLYLQVHGPRSKSWIFQYRLRGHQRGAGFGSFFAVNEIEARKKAADWRFKLAQGIDPLEGRGPSAPPRAPAFSEVAGRLIESKRSGWRNTKHARQWETSLLDFCGPIWNTPVNEIDAAKVLCVLTPVWTRIPTTGARLRGRIEAVLDFAKAQGWRAGENAAQWKGNLAHLLARAPKVEKPHHKALPYADVPGFLADLRAREGMAARALEFLILTAVRSGDVRGACWGEIDLDRQLWSIPGSRMKGGREHVIPLSDPAMEILLDLLRDAAGAPGDLIFPGAGANGGLNSVHLGRLVPDGGTVHGFRSSFRDWAGDCTAFPREVLETSLAHTVGNAVERAYRRSNSVDRRRELMQSWAQFCADIPGGDIVPIGAGKR
jgi:integrase